MKKSRRPADTPPLPPLQQAIEDTYRAFANVRRPSRLDACPCCLDQGMVERLMKTPLRQLTSHDLRHYAYSVLLTSGSFADFRFFLPRLLDLCLRQDAGAVDPQLLLDRARMAEWQTWPAELQAALLGLFDAAFEAALEQSEDPGGAVDTWICALALAGLDVLPYLRRLETQERLPVLIGYHWCNAEPLSRGKLGNSYWSGRKALSAPVVQWFQSPPVREAIDRHYQLAAGA